MHDIFSEYRMAFFEETDEHLRLLNENCIQLEKDPNDLKKVDPIFRILHTLKSSAAAVGFNGLSLFSHQAEDLVQGIRNRTVEINRDVIDVLFGVFDRIKEFMEKARDNRESEVDFTAVAQKLTRMVLRKKTTELETPENKTAPPTEPALALNPEERVKIAKAEKQRKTVYWIRFEIDPAEPIKWLRAELLLNHLLKIGDVFRCTPPKEKMLQPSFSGIFYTLFASKEKPESIRKTVSIDLLRSVDIEPVRRRDVPPTEDAVSKKMQDGSGIRPDEKPKPSNVRLMTSGSIRVPVKRLDDLMHLVGEMVVLNSGLKLLEERFKNKDGDDPLQRELNLLVDKLIKITASVQTGVLKARMLPVEMIFSQYARIVRDLSKKENKEIDLILRGEDTEIDKKVIDAIGEPLTHLVRNAVDHGIEMPDVRRRAGKPARATITMTAAQTGNHILITVKDDGRGINAEKVKAKAVDQGLVLEKNVDTLTESEILNFMFELGFSTSDEVNSVSGRGIGLNVVRNVIGGLNGTVSVYSTPGQGTEFVITLPLTLAVTTVILVDSGGIRYGIPIMDIRESIKVSKAEIIDRHCVKAVNWSGRVVPVLGLNDILVDCHESISVSPDGLIPILIVAHREKELGLAVDRIMGKQEVVLKPLEDNFKSIRGISGAAVLGDGNVILVADILGVVQILKEIESSENKKDTQKAYGDTKHA